MREKLRRSPALLLEMMIALVLMSGVMGILFTGFYNAIKAKNFIKKEKEKTLNLQRLKLRFTLLFKEVLDVKKLTTGGYYLHYHAGIDPNPHFRTNVEAVLKIRNRVLSLTSWPPKEAPRSEVLSENIESFHVEFFDETAGVFLETYPNEKPFMMKVFINQEVIPLFL